MALSLLLIRVFGVPVSGYDLRRLGGDVEAQQVLIEEFESRVFTQEVVVFVLGELIMRVLRPTEDISRRMSRPRQVCSPIDPTSILRELISGFLSAYNFCVALLARYHILVVGQFLCSTVCVVRHR